MSNIHKYDPQQNRNMLIAMLIAGLIMFSFEIFYNQPIRAKHEAERQKLQAVQQIEREEQKNQLLKDIEQQEFTLKEPVTKTEIKAATKLRNEVIGKTPRVIIDNGSIHGSINLRGARFDDATLANYKQSVEKDSQEVIMASPNGTHNSSFIETGWWDASSTIATPKADSIWEVVGESRKLTQSTPITLKWDNGNGIIFYKEISIDNAYLITVKDKVENKSGEKLSLKPYGIISKKRPSKSTDGAIGIPEHNGGLTVVNDALEEIDFDKIVEEKSITHDGAKEWVGVTDKYWLKAIIPSAESFTSSYKYSGETSDKFQIDYTAANVEIAADAEASFTNKVFIGAKRLKTLEKYAEENKIHLFDRAVNFGWLYFLCEPLYQLLLIFHKWFGNWGVAIICLTICVKAALYPLSRKAYISMGKMKLIAPKLREVQEKYKDNRAELSQHMMAVYKKEGVNPAAGCLPILIQIPFFIALYRLIYSSIEMRHAPFFGWIHDLSASDPTSIWNLFGLLPYESPTFLAFGAWPIIMCITMYMQQMLNPAPSDPMQAKFIKAMPAFFLFMFYSFPAGLMIYWSFSNTITFLQQLYFTRKLQHLKPSEISKFQ